jgi:hypothetical protein
MSIPISWNEIVKYGPEIKKLQTDIPIELEYELAGLANKVQSIKQEIQETQSIHNHYANILMTQLLTRQEIDIDAKKIMELSEQKISLLNEHLTIAEQNVHEFSEEIKKLVL